MEKSYKKIEFGLGDNLQAAVKKLQQHEGLVCGEFNGQMLYSDIDDLDSAYKKVTGMTKFEFDEEKQKKLDQLKKEELEHQAAIPSLTEEWIQKGNAVLDEKYHDAWAECVPTRLSDLYQGMELGACLSIVKELNAGCSLEKAKEILESQGHSGMSHGLVCSMVKSFCERGNDFVQLY